MAKSSIAYGVLGVISRLLFCAFFAAVATMLPAVIMEETEPLRRYVRNLADCRLTQASFEAMRALIDLHTPRFGPAKSPVPAPKP